jgi:hypothetical protein
MGKPAPTNRTIGIIGINIFNTMLEELLRNKCWTKIGKAILGRNFDVTIGRAACEACSATWNLDNNSVFALSPRNTTENLD